MEWSDVHYTCERTLFRIIISLVIRFLALGVPLKITESTVRMTDGWHYLESGCTGIPAPQIWSPILKIWWQKWIKKKEFCMKNSHHTKLCRFLFFTFWTFENVRLEFILISFTSNLRTVASTYFDIHLSLLLRLSLFFVQYEVCMLMWV